MAQHPRNSQTELPSAAEGRRRQAKAFARTIDCGEPAVADGSDGEPPRDKGDELRDADDDQVERK